MEYNMDKDFITSTKSLTQDLNDGVTVNGNTLEKGFERCHQSIVNDFSRNENTLQKYIKEINEMYKIRSQPKEKLKQILDNFK